MSELYKRIASLCEEKGITGYRLCKDLSIQPSIVTDLKMGRRSGLKAETANKIAEYFGVTVGYLLGETDEKEKAPVLTKKDERDIEKRLEAMIGDLEGGTDGLMFSGEPLDEETRELLRISLRNQLEISKRIAKQKFTPKKYRKEGK